MKNKNRQTMVIKLIDNYVNRRDIEVNIVNPIIRYFSNQCFEGLHRN